MSARSKACHDTAGNRDRRSGSSLSTQACLHTHHGQVVHKRHSWPRRMQSHHSSSPAHTEQQQQATSANTDCSKVCCWCSQLLRLHT